MTKTDTYLVSKSEDAYHTPDFYWSVNLDNTSEENLKFTESKIKEFNEELWQYAIPKSEFELWHISF